MQEERDQLLQTVFTQSAELAAAEAERQLEQVKLLQESLRHLFLTGRLLSSDSLVADIDAPNFQPLKPAQPKSNPKTSPCPVSVTTTSNLAALTRDENSVTVTATSSYKPSPVNQQLGRGKYKPPIAPLLSFDRQPMLPGSNTLTIAEALCHTTPGVLNNSILKESRPSLHFAMPSTSFESLLIPGLCLFYFRQFILRVCFMFSSVCRYQTNPYSCAQ